MTVNFASVPFDEAIEYFRRKINLPTERWTSIMGGMHARAFVVAGAMKSELLSDLRAAVDRGLAEGTTITEFRKAFDETVKKNGWSYKGKRGWRTATIFNTNLRTAYAAGHYKQMTEPAVLKARPFWKYSAVLDGRVRPLHRSWHGTILPADDPWWKTYYPPNGWGCRCTVVSVSKSEMERDGLGVIKRPDDGTREWTDPSTGEVTDVPNGIDPGWAYNPGRAAWGENEAKRLMEDKGPWVDLNPWGPEAYGRPERIVMDKPVGTLGPHARTENDLRAALRNALGGDEAVLKDPTGETVMVTQAIVDHMLTDKKRLDGREAYFPLIPELIEAPYEVWAGFAKSAVSGRIGIRRKYVKGVQLDKERMLGLYAEFMNGLWVSGGFFRGGYTALNNLRKGRLLWGRK